MVPMREWVQSNRIVRLERLLAMKARTNIKVNNTVDSRNAGICFSLMAFPRVRAGRNRSGHVILQIVDRVTWSE